MPFKIHSNRYSEFPYLYKMEDYTLILTIAVAILGIIALVLVLVLGNLKIEFKINRERKRLNEDRDEVSLDILSNAEFQVLKLLSNGNTNKEIADELNISQATVKTHVSKIFRKLNLRKRSEARQFRRSMNIDQSFD
jgi:DNA-binding NarL/FixJ family response regulator